MGVTYKAFDVDLRCPVTLKVINERYLGETSAQLWVMVTDQTPFRGACSEVMYQHQHAPLPLERLNDVPQPVVVLLEKLLAKDPAQRFRTPNELLKAIPTITGAIDARRRITRQSLQKTPSAPSGVGTRKPPTRRASKKISIARLPVTGSDIFGREEDIAFLDDAWAKKDVNVITAAICGCNAGLFREVLHEVYIPRIQRGDAFFAANILGARGPLLSVLVHFFESGRWGSPADMVIEGQSLRRGFRENLVLHFSLTTIHAKRALAKQPPAVDS